jgi:hypothetical protein
MPEHARRFTAPPYDQFEDGDRVADWGADDLFTRMPRPRAVDDAPPPRFNRSVEPAGAPAGSAPLAAAPRAAAPLAAAPLAVASPPPAPLTPTPAAPRPLVLVEAPEDRREAPELARRGVDFPAEAPVVEQRRGPRDRRRSGQAGAEDVLERAERAGLSVVDPAPATAYRWDESGALIEPERGGRRTRVITGHPDAVPRPLPMLRSERRPARTPADWIGARPERIVAWAFVLGLILILIAISTADAATG